MTTLCRLPHNEESGKVQDAPAGQEEKARSHERGLVDGRVARYIEDPPQHAAHGDCGCSCLPKERREDARSRYLRDKKTDPCRQRAQQQRPREEKSHKGGVHAVGEHVVYKRKCDQEEGTEH